MRPPGAVISGIALIAFAASSTEQQYMYPASRFSIPQSTQLLISLHLFLQSSTGATLTEDGVLHEADTIIYATGFDLDKSLQPYKQIGLSEGLQELSPYAYYGMTHPDHPNFFVLLGPGTGLGHNSIIFMIECQVNYAADAITKMIHTGAKSMVLKPEVLKNYIEYVKKHMAGKVFGDQSTVASWYKNEAGVNWTLWPLDLVTYWWGTLACDMDLYFVRY